MVVEAKPLSPGWRLACKLLGLAMLLGAAGSIYLLVTGFERPDTSSLNALRETGVPIAARAGLLLVFARVLFGVGRRLLRKGFAKVPPQPAQPMQPPQPTHAAVTMTETSRPGNQTWSPATSVGMPPPGWQPNAFGPAAVTVVRIKCRTCGFLESEDARFCSSCGKGV